MWQILYQTDIALIIAEIWLRPGSVVIESGTGSGSLSSSLARVVAPTGKLYTFEFNQMRKEAAAADFDTNGAASVTTVTHCDVLANGAWPPISNGWA